MKKFIIIGALVTTLSVAAYIFYSRQVKLIQDMGIKLVGFSFDEIGFTETIFYLAVEVSSAATLQATVTELSMDVYVGKAKVGHINSVEPFVLPAKGKSLINLKVDFSPSAIASNIGQLGAYVLGNKDASVVISGEAKAKAAFINTSIPLSYETSIRQLI